MSPIKRMTSAFSSAGDRSSRLPGGDMPLQNLKSLYVESPDLSIFTRAVAPCPPTAADSKTSAARTFAPITTTLDNCPASVPHGSGRIAVADPSLSAARVRGPPDPTTDQKVVALGASALAPGAELPRDGGYVLPAGCGNGSY